MTVQELFTYLSITYSTHSIHFYLSKSFEFYLKRNFPVITALDVTGCNRVLQRAYFRCKGLDGGGLNGNGNV